MTSKHAFSHTFSDPPMNGPTNKYLFCWKTGMCINTNDHEIELFLGIHLLVGIVRMPAHRMYWANETWYNQIANIMSRNRFAKLRSSFHLSNNSQSPKNDTDKLYKRRPYIDKIKLNCNKIAPEEYNAVDKFKISFKGLSSNNIWKINTSGE